MNLYEIKSIEAEINILAEQNEGEIPENLLQQLVEAQSKNLESVGRMIRYIKHLEFFIENAKSEKQRIDNLKKQAENRIESIKKHLAPAVKEYYNGKVDAGTFTLSLRKSQSVELEETFFHPEYCETIITYKPDKKKIKAAIDSGIDIPGARIEHKENLQIK